MDWPAASICTQRTSTLSSTTRATSNRTCPSSRAARSPTTPKLCLTRSRPVPTPELAGPYAIEPLTENEATLLLSVSWCGRSPEDAAFREQHLELERDLRLFGLLLDSGTPSGIEASADVQYSLRLTRGDHLNDREDPFAEPPWWRHPRLGDEDYLQELLYGDATLGSELGGSAQR